MNNNLDSVNLELIVTACQMEADNIWMQGDLEIRLNTEKPYADSDIINVDEFLKSLEQDGEFSIFSCCCGIPACSGWKFGIQVLHLAGIIKWTNPNNGKTWSFSKQKVENDLILIREELTNYKYFFNQRKIEYVGVGYNW
jgi:hypothetical protein